MFQHFPTAEFKKHSTNIAWETEVWVVDFPRLMIHFNGDKFYGATLSQHTKAYTFARHTKPTHKSQPCKVCFFANAQATLCGWTQTHIIDDNEEGRTHNRGFAKIRADGSYLRLFVCLVLK